MKNTKTFLAKLKEGDQIMVRSTEKAGWTRAYFAAPADGLSVYVYKDGKTRWSSGGAVEAYIFWKFPELDDLILTTNPVLTGMTQKE